MFHTTRLGQFADHVRQYADLNGYVPEAGDDYDDMSWDAQTDWTDDAWADFVRDAIRATERAEADSQAWRSRPHTEVI